MKIIKNMEFIQTRDPNIKKPIIIAAMQDMGNVGSIVINFINQSLKTESFRTAKVSFPTYNGACGVEDMETIEFVWYTQTTITYDPYPAWSGTLGAVTDLDNILCSDVKEKAESKIYGYLSDSSMKEITSFSDVILYSSNNENVEIDKPLISGISDGILFLFHFLSVVRKCAPVIILHTV